MSKTPFMPLWVSDFLGDTLDLETAEIGAYMLLLMAQWKRQGASLPNDKKKLQRVARCGRNWAKVWANLDRFFEEDENGIFNKRMRLEAQNVAAKREINARNGALGGNAKALKAKQATLASATETQEHIPNIPEPEPYNIEDTNVSLSSRDDAPPHANEISEAVAVYNKAARDSGWPQVQKTNPTRSKQIRARLKDSGGVCGWRVAIEKAQASDFICGRTGKPWSGFGFDWLIKSQNFTKLMEGNYDNRTHNNEFSQPGPSGSGSAILDAAAVVARRRTQQA